MIREDRELLAELSRLNRDAVPLAMRIMDESVHVSAEEQYAIAHRLIAMAARLQVRASPPWDKIEGVGVRNDNRLEDDEPVREQ